MWTYALSLALLQSPALPPPLTERNSFPFVIPWDDGTAGVATDMRPFGHRPAGAHGRIQVRNGQFVDGRGERMRFLGTNIGSRAAFPPKELAPILAARIAKHGINVVRFHHLNNGWDPDGSVWKKGRTFLEIDPAMIDRFDYYVAELIKQGVYVNVNLQTARQYLPEMGFPPEVSQIPNFQKKIDKIDRRMIELQKEYARDLIGRRNPYTGKTYSEDPGILKVEINNENSLVGWPGESPGAGIESWPPAFRNQVVTRWNQWLKTRYQTDAKLAQAWPRVDTRKPEIRTANQIWTHENQSNGDVIVEVGDKSENAAPNLKVTVNSNPGPNWHVQAHIPGLTFEDGKTYTVSFRARGDRELAFGIDSRLAVPDWRFLGLGSTVRVSPEWRDYVFSFRAQGGQPNQCRLGLVLGETRGTIWVHELQIREGELQAGVPAGESLAGGNLSIPAAEISPRYQDFTRFLVELETAYSEEMANFLRNDLGFKETQIIDTQAAWGGLSSLIRERRMGFADNHAYWNHPIFLGRDWDPQNYRVDRRALVNELDGGMGTMMELALYRVAGRPYSVSEYCHPAPNDFQSEMMPIFGAFGALQNWDVLYTFAYPEHDREEARSRIQGFFDTGGNPAIAAFYPSTTLIFRQGMLPSLGRVVRLETDPEPWSHGNQAHQLWAHLNRTPNLRRERIELALGSKAQVRESGPTLSQDAVQVTSTPRGKIAHIESAKALVITGFAANQSLELNAGSFRFGDISGGHASLTLVPLDGRPLAESERMLLTLCGRVENLGMRWNTERTSVSDQWGTGPTLAEVVPLEVRLRAKDARKVFALDGRGRRTRELTTVVADGRLRFQVDETARTLWFEITK